MQLLREYIRSIIESGQNNFVRFGQWPENERSVVRVTDDESYEEGVSVFETNWNSKVKKWEIWAQAYGIGSHDPVATLQAYVTKMKMGAMPAFLVTGDVVGTGHDREPVLRNVRKIKQLKCEEIYAPQYENPAFGGRDGFGIPGEEHIDCDTEGWKKHYG